MPCGPVGILALQGCIDPHRDHLARLGVESVFVRAPQDLERIERIILPGGESTTMLKLLRATDLWEPLKRFVSVNPVWGICAGAILLARKVVHPEQESLGVVDIVAHRNYFGSQRDSFEATIEIPEIGDPIGVQFIRAPRLRPLESGASAELAVLAEFRGDAVLIRQGSKLVSSFHTELGTDSRLHNYFVDLQ